MNKTNLLREKNLEELKSELLDLDRQIFRLRDELKVARKLEKPHQLSVLKKQRARILTILTEKQQGQENGKR